MASSSIKKTCLHCKDSNSDQFSNGWQLRDGSFAQLCNQCAPAYEEGRFCEAFHLDVEGWRECVSCGKLVHCGCIVSFHAYILFDFGGIICMECSRNNLIMDATPAEFVLHLSDPCEVELSNDTDKVIAGINSGADDPIPPHGSAVPSALPNETTGHTLALGTSSQAQAPGPQLGEKLCANSPSGIDTSS